MPLTRAVVGESTTLKCAYTCADDIIWYKDNTILRKGDKYAITGGLLHIDNVTVTDNGTYFCRFRSGREKPVFSPLKVVRLMISVPTDRVHMTSTFHHDLRVGDDVEITCRANGLPLPQSVVWLNNSLVIISSERITSTYDSATGVAKLTLRRLGRYNSGIIKCKFNQELRPGLWHESENRTILQHTGWHSTSFSFLCVLSK